ncbi:MAG: T9SS type A sorting domain-containing protein [Bacteroidia bacterium]
MNVRYSIFSLFLFLLLHDLSFAQPGTLDNSFDSDGIQLYIDPGYTTTANVILVLPDSSILTVGERYGGFGGQLLMLGYQADGSVNTNFGRNNTFGNPVWGYPGIVHTDVPGSNREYGYAAVRQPDGKIIVGGAANTMADWLLVRYHPNGDIDSTFGGTGIIQKDWGGFDQLLSLHLQSDGKIIASGTANQDLGACRFEPDGTPDTGFGINGEATLGLSGWGGGGTMAVDALGQIYICGITNGNYILGRLNANGTKDTGFGNNGIATITSNDFPTQIFVGISPGGLPVIVADEPSNFGTNSGLLLARFLSNGSPDPAFGGGDGKVSSALGTFVSPRSMRIQPDGKILVTGQLTINGARDMFVAKYNTDGSPDAGFGSNGLALSGLGVDLASTYSNGQSLALQPDGKIILGGIYTSTGLNHLALARFHNDVDASTSIGDLLPGIKLGLYPNPTPDRFFVPVPEGKWNWLTVRDIAGRQVYVQTINAEKQLEIDLSELPASLYIVELSGGSGFTSGKIRKQ